MQSSLPLKLRKICSSINTHLTGLTTSCYCERSAFLFLSAGTGPDYVEISMWPFTNLMWGLPLDTGGDLGVVLVLFLAFITPHALWAPGGKGLSLGKHLLLLFLEIKLNWAKKGYGEGLRIFIRIFHSPSTKNSSKDQYITVKKKRKERKKHYNRDPRTKQWKIWVLLQSLPFYSELEHFFFNKMVRLWISL